MLDRLGENGVPPALEHDIATLRGAQAIHAAARTAAEKRRLERDDVLEALGDAGDAVSTGVEILATAIVGAKVGPRRNPFRGLSRCSPSKVVSHPCAVEARDVAALVSKLARRRPPPSVAKAAARYLRDAKALETVLSKLARAQVAYARAFAASDALLPEVAAALRRLERHAVAGRGETTRIALSTPRTAAEARKNIARRARRRPTRPPPAGR